ncbi:hypothetical protein IKO18_02795 [bacterium]|jgi:hypothetical protein|nr:hypothetical protein [bacterium]
MGKLVLSEDLRKTLDERCSEWVVLNIVVHLQSESEETNKELIELIKKENPGSSVACIDSTYRDGKEDTVAAFQWTDSKGG